MGIYSFCDVVRAAGLLHDILLLLQAVHRNISWLHAFIWVMCAALLRFVYVVNGGVLL